MKMTYLPSADRGRTRLDWLDSRHSFSFGHYYDPRRMGFGALRVINEDIVQPDRGFATHAHADMEIVSIVLDGTLAHRDSTGSAGLLQAGDVQCMSAGRGIEHSEYNPSSDQRTHFLQIWLHPLHPGREPAHEQRHFSAESRRNLWCPVVSMDGAGGSLAIDQDVSIFMTGLDAGARLSRALDARRRAWLQLTRGTARVGDCQLQAGDALALQGAERLELEAVTDMDAVLFDLA